MTTTHSPKIRIARLSRLTLTFTIAVILLGALVRATGSGAGCGRSWPSCQGEILPARLEGATLIEFTHRVVSGIALALVFLLFVVIRRANGVRAQIRTAAAWSLVAIVGEALIGAAIVLFEWVADDSSVARAIAVPLHLVNTLLLLAGLTAVVALVDGRRLVWPAGRLRQVVAGGLGALLVVAATGAVAALADTLYPADSLAEGVAADLSGTSAMLTRLRVIHPIVAVATGLLLVWLVSRPRAVRRFRDSTAARAVVWLVVLQVAVGALNVVLLVPIWTQLVHLLLADLLWISFVWFSLEALTAHNSAVSAS